MTEKTIPLSKIIPYENNARINSAAIAPVKESIERYGYNTPIIVDEKNVIICGHTRYEALKELGWDKCVVLVSTMTEDQAKAFRLAENRSAEVAVWDYDKLIAEVRMVESSSMDKFFQGDELEVLMGGLENDVTPSVKVSQEQVDRQAERLDNHFQETSENLSSRTKKVKCQHCGETYEFTSRF